MLTLLLIFVLIVKPVIGVGFLVVALWSGLHYGWFAQEFFGWAMISLLYGIASNTNKTED